MGDTARFGELSAALAILVGLVLVALGVLHVGFVSRFISASVQAGFMFGLGLTISSGRCRPCWASPRARATSSPSCGIC
jgi:SulP family sulfate permease